MRAGKYILFSLFILINAINQGCKKEVTVTPQTETGIITDIEGNVYKTIKIGDQWWMAENLKVRTYRDGAAVKYSLSTTDWIDSSASYCIYDNNTSAPGLLYNWHAVNQQLAPAGWHIPTDAEWKKLEEYLGMPGTELSQNGWRGNQGTKLKKEGTSGWSSSDAQWPTNESGFTALAGSCRLFNGVWGDPGLFATGFWWTSTQSLHGDQAYYRYLDSKQSGVFRSYCDKKYGFSVRCIKD
jgi:uncharacterized protein (TIGR02145 family)